ncbi:TetR family transcriptional regulator [Halomonas halocynthiae]|uniref:TetR family transcriptional regulator n=1 Tax=Halomonas halocynthiae TaxID=176290 RepID=UPI0004198A2C|nr:TetR family transcriptional regulator [Halomonas halocynthiae]
MARRTKADAKATREALLDAAEELFFQRGVACSSLEQIARHASMTRGAVYWHFRNKADLFTAMIERVRMPFHELVSEASAAHPHTSPLAAIQLGCEYGFQRLEKPRYMRVHAIVVHRCEVFSDIDPREIQNTMVRDCFNALKDYLEDASQQGLLKPDIDPLTAALLLQAVLSGIFHNWLRDPQAHSIYEQGSKLVKAQLALISLKPLS